MPVGNCTPPIESPTSVSCETCTAACCRLEALCITDTGVPERYLQDNPGGAPSMRRLADGWCAALDRDTLRCRIYARRPLVCRELEMGGPDCLAAREEWTAAGS